MKNKIFIAIDILLGIALIVCIVFFTNTKKEQSELDKKLSTAESAYKAKEAEYQLKTAPNEISTPDEIAIMKRELNDLSKEKDGGVESFKQMFFNYIDTLYNTEGNFQSNKSKIIESLKNIVSPAMMENKIEPMFSIGSGNGTKTEKKKYRTSVISMTYTSIKRRQRTEAYYTRPFADFIMMDLRKHAFCQRPISGIT